MKKLFTLLSMCLFAMLPALAVVTDQSACKFEPRPEMSALQAKVQKNFGSMKAGDFDLGESNKVIRRKYQDGTDIYNMVLVNLETHVVSVFKVGPANEPNHPGYTFEEFPYYVCQLMLSRTDINNNITAEINCLVSWPSYNEWDMEYHYVKPEDKEGLLKMVSIEDMVDGAKKYGYCSLFQQSELVSGHFSGTTEHPVAEYYPIWTNTYNKLYSSEGVNLKQSIGNVTGSFCTEELYPNSLTKVRLNDYDEEESTMNCSWDVYVMTDDAIAAQKKTAKLNVNFNGTFRQLGFVLHNYEYELGQVHIFNCGNVSPSILGSKLNNFDALDNKSWPEMQLFYISAPNKYIDVTIDEGMTKFNRDQLKYGWKEGLADSDMIDENMCMLEGYLWAPVGTDIKNGIEFRLLPLPKAEALYAPLTQEKFYPLLPKENCMVPGRVAMPSNASKNCGWSESWGMNTTWSAYFWDWRTDKGQGSLSLHTADGLQLQAFDEFGNHYSFAPNTQKIKYHGNPNNVFADVVDIDNAGTFVSGVDEVAADAEAYVSFNNGVVTVAGKADVAIYTLNGAVVAAGKVNGVKSFNVGKGVYVVKAGDKAQKVVM